MIFQVEVKCLEDKNIVFISKELRQVKYKNATIGEFIFLRNNSSHQKRTPVASLKIDIIKFGCHYSIRPTDLFF
jgi:hypothetical protein